MKKQIFQDLHGSGKFGRWGIDEFGLPIYEYSCMQTLEAVARTPTSGRDSIDHWHQVGNDRITLTAHNGGYVQFFLADRGMQWLSYRDKKTGTLGGGICLIEENGKIWADFYTSHRKPPEILYKRIFGCGYFKKILVKNKLKIEHMIIPPFGNDPVVLSQIKVTNNSKDTRTITVYDFWDVKIYSLIGSLLAMLIIPKDRTKFGTTKVVNMILRGVKTLLRFFGMASDQVRERFSAKFAFRCEFDPVPPTIRLIPEIRGKVPVQIHERADRNYFFNPIFLASWNTDLAFDYFNKYELIQNKTQNAYLIKKRKQVMTDATPCLAAGHQMTLKPQESCTLRFIFGTAPHAEISKLIDKYSHWDEKFLKENFRLWKESFLYLNVNSEPWITREVTWHSYYLRSATLYDNYYENHFLPQGNAYTFLHGANGAIRDYVLFLVPMIYLNPHLAREMIEYICRVMTPEGELPYALVGYGQNLGAIVHETSSDLHLFFLWGLLEYLYITRDFTFLAKKIPFYPLEQGITASVLDRIELSLKFLFQKVGIGEHGMLKVGSGDWSDGISLLVKNRRALLKKGESTFNTAFAVYLFPRLLDLLKSRKPPLARFLKRRYEQLQQACLESWNGRWFYRGWDGQGNPIGNKNLFLEHHSWLLLSKILTPTQWQSVIHNIYKILDEPSKTGQFILFPPARVLLNILPRGWDVNGGIWSAMNFLLTWAYGDYDRTKAYQSLVKNSLARRATVYPHIWYGIWSGSDSYNADYSGVPSPGQTFIHPATPQTDFPVMNLNLHASFLGSVIKLTGIQGTFNGLVIDPKFPHDTFQFWSPLISLEKKSDEFTGHYAPIQKGKCFLKVKIPQEWNHEACVYINGQDITETFKFEGEWLKGWIKIPESGISFSIKTR
ncbi:MAG: GH36-type glycosyl hydrolase domain-containing protein [Candidatus Helarchaeota archaeon]